MILDESIHSYGNKKKTNAVPFLCEPDLEYAKIKVCCVLVQAPENRPFCRHHPEMGSSVVKLPLMSAVVEQTVPFPAVLQNAALQLRARVMPGEEDSIAGLGLLSN